MTNTAISIYLSALIWHVSKGVESDLCWLVLGSRRRSPYFIISFGDVNFTLIRLVVMFTSLL